MSAQRWVDYELNYPENRNSVANLLSFCQWSFTQKTKKRKSRSSCKWVTTVIFISRSSLVQASLYFELKRRSHESRGWPSCPMEAGHFGIEESQLRVSNDRKPNSRSTGTLPPMSASKATCWLVDEGFQLGSVKAACLDRRKTTFFLWLWKYLGCSTATWKTTRLYAQVKGCPLMHVRPHSLDQRLPQTESWLEKASQKQT